MPYGLQLIEEVGLVAVAIVYALAWTILLNQRWSSRAAWPLLVVIFLTLVWSVFALFGDSGSVSSGPVPLVLEQLRVSAWVLLCVAMLTLRSIQGVAPEGSQRRAFALALLPLLPLPVLLFHPDAVRQQQLLQYLTVLTCVFGLGFAAVIGVTGRRSAALCRPLLGAVFLVLGTDAAIYCAGLADAMELALQNSIRAVAYCIAVPLLLISSRRFESRGPVFYVSHRAGEFAAGVVIAAAIVALAAVIGAALTERSGQVTNIVGFSLLLCVLLPATVFLLSRTGRRSLGVFLARHFYRNRYDYRKVLLQLISTLASKTSESTLYERSVQALAEIVKSPGGVLWLADESGTAMEPCAAWNLDLPANALTPADMLVSFLIKSLWVLDTFEYSAEPARYERAFESHPELVESPSIVVPLVKDGRLVGIVRLQRPDGMGRLSFEDHDLLKTAGQQIAIFLAQEKAQEELFQTRQFEAFSKLTAFLMHDLKNLIAQQELVVGNARKFRDRPEFVDDAFSTIASSVTRMRTVLDRLQNATREEQFSQIDLAKLLKDVCIACSDRSPSPKLRLASKEVWVAMDRDKLSAAITHAVRNAQDATHESGDIDITLSSTNDSVQVEISDTGKGMDAGFVRDRLFRPFDSTKGAQGMGIGAYQIRETIRHANGEVQVISEPGRGTALILRLPHFSNRHEGRDASLPAA